MTAILSVSMPVKTKELIKETAKRRGISVSRYILHAVVNESDLISEEQLLRDIAEAEEAYKNGECERMVF